MIPRLANTTLLSLAEGFPIVSITGPRQSGKTTLAKSCFSDKPYTTLEDPDIREFANLDPRAFLAQYPDGAILDEIQRCPELFSYLQGIVDNDTRMGLFVLTGSQQFSLNLGISQSLAGRVGMIHLLPFSQRELTQAGILPAELDYLLFQGSYPPLYNRKIKPSQWYANYVTTYLERDVRQLINIKDMSKFQRFLRVCAHHVGQLVNLTRLSNDCGVNYHTIESWLSVLEASYIVVRVKPWYRNFNKRLVKTPKLYFYDTGLASWLLGIRDIEQIRFHAMRGALFENYIISEAFKSQFNQGELPEIWFWRDRTGHEVDLIIEYDGQYSAVEIKSGTTLSNTQFKALRYWQTLVNDKRPSVLIYGGDELQVRSGINVVPWKQLSTLPWGRIEN